MNVRCCLPLCLGALLCACPAHAPDDLAPGEVPMCRATPPPAGVPAVRVQVASNGDANPTLCVIRSGTEVIWEKRGASPFMLKFKQVPGVPVAGWRPGEPGRFTITDSSKQFPSSGVGSDQEVRLQIKEVTAAEDIDYCVATAVDCVDPGIRILPR